MDFVNSVVDVGIAPEFAIDGMARAELLNGRLRITLYRETLNGDGSIQRYATCSIVWTLPAFLASRAQHIRLREYLEKVISEEPPVTPAFEVYH